MTSTSEELLALADLFNSQDGVYGEDDLEAAAAALRELAAIRVARRGKAMISPEEQSLVERMRSFEVDHVSDGWPAIQMRDVSALCDLVDSLCGELAAIKESRGKVTDGIVHEARKAYAKVMDYEYRPDLVFPQQGMRAALEAVAPMFAQPAEQDARFPGHVNPTSAFKAFHSNLCRRFGYTHDDAYWWRDLVSLEEHIAAKLANGSDEQNRLHELLYQAQTAQPQAVEAEPVAWLLRKKLSGFIRGCYSDKPSNESFQIAEADGDEYIPLYLHPPQPEPSAKVAEWAATVFRDFWNSGEPGDLDGGDLQNLAIACGLLTGEEIETDEGCGENCNCVSNGSGAGDLCYRLTDACKAMLAAAPTQAPSSEKTK